MDYEIIAIAKCLKVSVVWLFGEELGTGFISSLVRSRQIQRLWQFE
jgi:hypothetical protein